MRLALLVPLLGGLGYAGPACATGTVAGTTISNTASASYTDPTTGNPVVVPSNKLDLRVDELLNVVVASADPGDVTTTPGATNQLLSFTITNSGNGSEAFRLTPYNAIGGDAFDPVTTSVVIDSNGNGTYDANDQVYTPGGNDPVLAPDASVKVFVLSSMPAGSTNGQRGQTDLEAKAVTGTGSPGTIFAGAGANGGDAIVGASTALGRAGGFYLVTTAGVAFVKSATVLDPFGGTKAVPDAVITYTLTATVTGSGSLANLAVTDPLPAATSYESGTLTLQGGPLTDATGDDAGEVVTSAGASQVAVRLGTVAAGSSRSVAFKVRIK